MKNKHNFTCLRILKSLPCAFAKRAGDTGKSQIFSDGFAPLLRRERCDQRERLQLDQFAIFHNIRSDY